MLELQRVVGPTGKLLEDMLKERGLIGGTPKGVVFYGYVGGQPSLPTLNVNAGRLNKYEELGQLDDAGVTTIPFSGSAADLRSPILGRRYHHTRGNDIFVYNVRPLLRGDHLADYYTELIPKRREFRVWAFRDKCLANYEKVLTYPEKLGRRGRNKAIWNWANGYAYKFRRKEDVPAGLRQLGINAVKALDLDYGAVDIIEDESGYLYVLEVNTAPGTQGEERQGITSLVDAIQKWDQAGFPARG